MTFKVERIVRRYRLEPIGQDVRVMGLKLSQRIALMELDSGEAQSMYLAQCSVFALDVDEPFMDAENWDIYAGRYPEQFRDLIEFISLDGGEDLDAVKKDSASILN